MEKKQDVGGVNAFRAAVAEKKEALKAEAPKPEVGLKAETGQETPPEHTNTPKERPAPPEKEPVVSPTIEDVQQEITPLSQEEKEAWFSGIARWGFKIQEWKGAAFASLYRTLTEKTTRTNITAERNALSRFFGGLTMAYGDMRDQAQKNQEGLAKNSAWRKRAFGTGALMGNALFYGRTIYDFAGTWMGNPLRWVTLGAMALGRAAEAVKEARFAGKKSYELSRNEDEEQAAEEAWRLYEMAGGKAGALQGAGASIENRRTVSKQDLERVFKERMSSDILERIGRGRALRERWGFSSLAQTVTQKRIEKDIVPIQKKLDAIEAQPVPQKEKDTQKAAVLARYAKVIKEADALITRTGTVDMVAYGSRFVEHVGKGVAVFMLLETLAEGVWRLGSAAAEFSSAQFTAALPHGGENAPSSASSSSAPVPTAAPTAPVAETAPPATAPSPESIAAQAVNGEIEAAATVHKGEGVEHAFIRQIKLHPELFGFTGDPHDVKALDAFAGTKAHQIAIRNGYVRMEGYVIAEETRVAKPETSLYILHPDNHGGATVEAIKASEYTYDPHKEYEEELMAREEAARAVEGARAHAPEPPKETSPEPQKLAPTVPPPETEPAVQEPSIPTTPETPERAHKVFTFLEKGLHIKPSVLEHLSHKEQYAALTSPQLTAIEIAYRDLARGNPSDETVRSYLDYTASLLTSGQEEDANEWIGTYKTMLERDAQSGFLPYSEKDIEQKTTIIRELLSARETGEQERAFLEGGIGAGVSHPAPAETPSDMHPVPEAPAEERHLEHQPSEPHPQETAAPQEPHAPRTPEEHALFNNGIKQVREKIDMLQKQIDRAEKIKDAITNPTLRSGHEGLVRSLTVEKELLTEVLNHPERYAAYDTTKDLITFKGVHEIHVPPNVASVGTSQKPFEFIFSALEGYRGAEGSIDRIVHGPETTGEVITKILRDIESGEYTARDVETYIAEKLGAHEAPAVQKALDMARNGTVQEKIQAREGLGTLIRRFREENK